MRQQQCKNAEPHQAHDWSSPAMSQYDYYRCSGIFANVVDCSQGVVDTERVNHPAHYGGDTTYEVIKVIEAWGLDADFCLGNAVKYVARAGKKDDAALLDDLKKAAWYLGRKIARLEENGGNHAPPT